MNELEKVFSLREAKLWYEKFAGTVVAVKDDLEQEIHSLAEAIGFFGDEEPSAPSSTGAETPEEAPAPEDTAPGEGTTPESESESEAE